MINEMSTHASMYIPLSIPSTQLPQYVNLDRNSQWHTSALLSAASESITLSTRLRRDNEKYGFVDDLEAALNVNGNQRIAQLQCSMFDPDNSPIATAITHGSTDSRAPSGNKVILFEEDGLKRAEPRFDMDLSCCSNQSTSRSAIRPNLLDHTFGAVKNVRTKIRAGIDEQTDEDKITETRKQRRLAGLPIIERFVLATWSRILSLQRVRSYAANPAQVPLLA